MGGTMTTTFKFGPSDHGRALTLEEFFAGDYEEGFRFELIDGELYVSPEPDLADDWVEKWINAKLYLYSLEHLERHQLCDQQSESVHSS